MRLFLVGWAVLLVFGAVGLAIKSNQASSATGSKPEEIQASAPQSKPAEKHTQEVPEHIQGACMSKVQGLIPNGTRVIRMSVAYSHSLDHSLPVLQSQVYSLSDVNFYTVTVEAEIQGRRFSSRYGCRQWGNAIEIMRG